VVLKHFIGCHRKFRLQTYPLRIDVAWWFFVVPLITLLAIAILTISFKIVSTARANPVDALRYE